MTRPAAARRHNARTGAATVLAMALLVPQSAAAQLPGLIEQNVKSATSSAGRLSGDLTAGTTQLWIHVRNDGQKREVEGKLAWFRGLRVGGRNVDVRPIQVVTSGPQQSQLRFFKQGDQAQAQALLVELRKAVPAIALQDMSSQYRQVSWIERGHFELWLGASVTRITTP